MSNSFTPGPWLVGPVDDTVVTAKNPDGTMSIIAEIDGDYNQPDTWPVMEANARLIAAAPELIDVALNFEFREEAETGDLWMHLHGNGTTGSGAFNLGRGSKIVLQVARLLEEQRRAAIAKATGAA